MSGYAETDLVECECGVIAAHHLDCGDPCCGRCSHPDWTEGAPWTRTQPATVQPAPALAAENGPGMPVLPEHNGGVVASGLPPQESPLKRMALHQLAETADPWDDR